MDEASKLLVPFLRKLADSIENKTLSDEQIFKVGEFFMSFLFHQELLKGAMNEDDREFFKFLTLGWWVYKNVLRDAVVE